MGERRFCCAAVDLDLLDFHELYIQEPIKLLRKEKKITKYDMSPPHFQ